MPLQSLPQASTVTDKLWIAGLAIGLPMLAMMLLGLDANWDLRNYHLYNPHAWLTGRTATDIAAAQVQSWHNPLLDVPLYLIVTSGVSPRWASAWLTMPCIAAIFFLLRLQRVLGSTPPTRTSQTVLALLGLTGAATYSTLGLSMNDAFVAAAILGSLLLLLRDQPQGKAWQSWLLAGMLAGAITGLKLTAIFYCIALACCTLVGGRWKEKLLHMGSLGAGGLLGFLLTYGYWGWRLFATYGNPFFPYYNNVFRSAQTLPETWAAPVQLLSRSREFCELTMSDPRLLLALLGLLALYLLHRRQQTMLRERIGMLLVFVVVSSLLWVFQYGIYRYVMALELLGCLALVLLLQWLPRGRNIALLAALVLVSADTKRPNWGRVRSAAPVVGINAPAIPADSLVIIATGEPLAYLALGLPDSVPLIGVSNNMMSPERCTGLQLRAQQRIEQQQGPLWLLSSMEAGGEQGQSLITRHYGLQADGPCLPFTSAIGSAQLCRQKRATTPAGVCPTYKSSGAR